MIVVISSLLRPHINDGPEDVSCWCKPTMHDCGAVMHRDLEHRPDNQPRMSSYSEQRLM